MSQAERQQARRDRLRREGVVTLGPLYIPASTHRELKRQAAANNQSLMQYATRVLNRHTQEINLAPWPGDAMAYTERVGHNKQET